MKNKVSVIIAIYNTKPEFLKECLNSIISQTYKNIEIILVNDGSKEYIKDICSEYTKKDKRIKYIYQKNQGCSVARNNGLKKSTGDYILFVDHDDTLEPDYINLLLRKNIKNKTDFCLMSWFAGEDIKNIGAFITFAALIKKDFLKNNPDVCFPKGIQPCEDGIFSHKLLALTQNGCIEEKAVYHWRNYDEQTTAITDKQTEKILSDIPEWFAILEKFYLKHRLITTKGKHLLRFIENEPFGLRLNKMPFSHEQKEMLFNTIHDFVKKYNLYAFVDDTFSKKFIIFLNSSSYDEYQKILNKENKKCIIKRFLLNILIKTMFIKKYRYKLKEIRNNIKI